MKTRTVFFAVLFSLFASGAMAAENIIGQEQAAQTVEIRNVEHKGNMISGEVTNKSRHTLRNIELLVQYHWLWKNEFKPGSESPGKAVFVTLDKELAPGQSTTFSVPVEAPSGERDDGYYSTKVSLAGFTEVIPQTVG